MRNRFIIQKICLCVCVSCDGDWCGWSSLGSSRNVRLHGSKTSWRKQNYWFILFHILSVFLLSLNITMKFLLNTKFVYFCCCCCSGVTVVNPEDAIQAQFEGADYLGIVPYTLPFSLSLSLLLCKNTIDSSLWVFCIITDSIQCEDHSQYNLTDLCQKWYE